MWQTLGHLFLKWLENCPGPWGPEGTGTDVPGGACKPLCGVFVPLVPPAPTVPKIAVPPQKEQFPHREQGKVLSKVSLRIWDGEVIPCKTLYGDGETKPPLEAAQIYLEEFSL